MADKNLQVIGQAEFVDLMIEPPIAEVPARIDTGARTSAIWASDIHLNNGQLHYKLFGPNSEFYTGKDVVTDSYSTTVVASSNGAAQQRFKVMLPIRLKGRKIQANFTLADRSSQVYPVLIGRGTLRGKFVVDVKAGTVLKEREQQRTTELNQLFEDKAEV